MSEMQSWGPVLPELIVAIGSMLLLVYGVFRPDTDASGRTVGWLAILVLLIAGLVIVLQPAGSTAYFEGAFVVDGFARFMKILVLGGAAVALLWSLDELSDFRQMRF